MDSTQAGTDAYAVSEGYVSITPIRLDWSDHKQAPLLERALAQK